MNDCVFCRIVKGEISADVVYEDDEFLGFLDITPVNPGHVLLIPKKHYENLYDLPDEVLSKMAPLIKKIALAVKKGVKKIFQLSPPTFRNSACRFEDERTLSFLADIASGFSKNRTLRARAEN